MLGRRAASYTVRYLRVEGHPDHAWVRDKIKVSELWLDVRSCSSIYTQGSQVEKLVFTGTIHDFVNSHFGATEASEAILGAG